jgi:N-methylhydantoinase A/oxoprolinase/acetone carboxylase beta subunit
MADLRVGVEIGDSSVDSIVLDDRDHVAVRSRQPLGGEEADSIAAALAAVTASGAADPARIDRAVLGSTAATAAIERAGRLRRVAVLRIGGPLTHAMPPLTGWPAALRERVSAGERTVEGGADYDGQPVSALDQDAIMRFLVEAGRGAEAVSVTSLFSPVAPEQELQAAELVRRELGASTQVSLSHEIGSLGLLERENATVLNAALGDVGERLAGTFGSALSGAGIDAELFFAKGDGTVMSLEHALRFPVHLAGSGLASAMNGAAWLSGAIDGVMMSVGARSTSVGMLVGGLPSEQATAAEIGGVRINLRVPEVVTLAVGGATVLEIDGPTPAIGPPHDGLRVQRDALVFGGEIPTATDAAVAGGRIRLGSHSLSAVRQRELAGALPLLDRLLAGAVDSAHHALPAATVVVFGGASFLAPERLAGVGEMLVPAHGDIAGAVGLVVAPAVGRADRICANRPAALQRAIETARADALAQAIHAGADPATARVVEFEEAPLTYLHDPPIRIRVKAAGRPL